MNIKYILLLVLVFPMLSSCHEEDKLTPASTEMDLRFEFPEGDNPWDQDILEIVDKFSTYLIYKNLTKEDFNHTWQSVMGSYGGEPLNDEQAAFYTSFIKNHVFEFLKPELVKRVLPTYIYLAYNMSSTSIFGVSPLELKFDGMDFWGICLEAEKLGPLGNPVLRPATAWEFQVRRGIILKNVIEKIVTKGNIVVPFWFTDDFDYVTALDNSNSSLDNHYLKRGFPGQLSGTFSYETFGTLSRIYNTSPQRNLIDYIHLAIRYTRDEVVMNYPPDNFPKIIKYYDLTVEYLKENYDWDVTRIAELPVIDE